MSNEATIRAGERAFMKVGRNLVEVSVMGKAEGGWNVTSRTGKAMLARALQTVDGTPIMAEIATLANAETAASPSKTASKAIPQKGLGLLSAAAVVLESSAAPMTVKAMIEAAKDAGLWSPRGGKTPEQTLYSAIIREIRDKREQSRFRKDGRGLFAFVH